MPAWGLKLGAFLATALSLVGSTDYVTHHLKNVAAPLHPPVEGGAVAVAPAPSVTPVPNGTPLPTLIPARRGQTRPTSSPGPLITLQPGVRATALPAITLTHVS